MYERVAYERLMQIYELQQRSKSKLFAEFSQNTLVFPESRKWDFAIPENYTNYQDGFLFPNYEQHRWQPLLRIPEIGTLYLRYNVQYHELQETEAEKYLCFDRNGGKYTVIFTREEMPNGNPSYFDFLPKVKPYRPKRRK